MEKHKKKSKGSAIVGGIAVLAVLGALAPSDDQPKEEIQTPPAAVVSENQAESKSQIEELIANTPPSVSPHVQQETIVGPNPEKVPEPKEDAPDMQEQQENAVTKNPEVDPEQAFRELLLQYNYVGSSGSDKYHDPTCRWTKSINDSNLVHFDTADEATASGYVPCKDCNP